MLLRGPEPADHVEPFGFDAYRRAVFFPRSAILADRDNWGGAMLDDGGMAAARVMGSVCGHTADLSVCRDLIEQFRHHRAIAAKAGGELRFAVNSTARMSDVAKAIARCTLRNWGRP